MFGKSLELRFVNQTARDLMALTDAWQDSPFHPAGGLRRHLFNLGAQVMGELTGPAVGYVETKATIKTFHGSVLVRAFGIPTQNRTKQPQVVMVMEAASR